MEESKQEIQGDSTVSCEESDLDLEIEALKLQLAAVDRDRNKLIKERTKVKSETFETRLLLESMVNRINSLEYEISHVNESIQSVDEEIAFSESSYEKNKQINIMNDAFYIWFTGPYATINSLRLGNLPNKPIDFTEINAALGQAALAVHIVASKAGIDFKSFVILPMGSFPKVLKADDRRTFYPLYIDSSTFSFFPKRNFNIALSGFMSCVLDVGEHINNHDPTLSLPYKINIADSRIGDISFTYGGDEEVWTRALKFMLSNIKWIIAWYAKHCTHAAASVNAESRFN